MFSKLSKLVTDARDKFLSNFLDGFGQPAFIPTRNANRRAVEEFKRRRRIEALKNIGMTLLLLLVVLCIATRHK